MKNLIRTLILISMSFIFSEIIIIPIDGSFNYEYIIAFEGYDANDDTHSLYSMDLDNNVDVIYQQPTRFGNIFLSSDKSEILFQNSLNEFYILEINANNQIEIMPTRYDIELDSIILSWEEDDITSATINDNQIRLLQTTNYFSINEVVIELDSFNSLRDDFTNISPDLISLSSTLGYIATPLIFSEDVNASFSVTPNLFIWNLGDDNTHLVESFEYPIEWWNLPQRSTPVWINDTSVAFLTHEGAYQTQKIILYDALQDNIVILYEYVCPDCNFISHLTYNEHSNEIMFWQPAPDIGWEMKGINLDSLDETVYVLADTVPTPIYISPDGNYVATSILNATDSLVVFDLNNKEMVTEHIVAQDNVELIGWIFQD